MGPPQQDFHREVPGCNGVRHCYRQETVETRKQSRNIGTAFSVAVIESELELCTDVEQAHSPKPPN